MRRKRGIAENYRRYRIEWISFLSICALSSHWGLSAETKPWILNLDKGGGKVTFKAIGRPSALKILGNGEAPKGQVVWDGKKISGISTFQLSSLDTGIKMRTEHMKNKYLEVSKYPEAKLTFSEIKIPVGLESEGYSVEKAPFKGTLSLHGKEKPVEGSAKITHKGEVLEVIADFGVKLSDYAIAIPSFAGITVTEDVEVNVRVEAPLHH